MPVLLDLCLYDVILQVIGLLLSTYVLNLNPLAPTPVPYHYLALTINWVKLTFMITYLLSGEHWPVFGPFSYRDERRKNLFGTCNGIWSGKRLGVTMLVYALPFLYCWCAYWLLVIRDNQPIDVRPIVGAILALVYLHQQNAHEEAAAQYDREATEAQIMAHELAFSNEQGMFFPPDMDLEAQELALWITTDRVSPTVLPPTTTGQ